MTQEVHVRAGVHLTQDAVEVERVRLKVDVVALREHHLKNVAGEDVFLRYLHRLLVHAVGHRAANLRHHLVRLRRLGGRSGQGHRQLVDCALCTQACGVVLPVDTGGVHVQHGHALDEVHPLAPMVECRQRTDDAHHSVGQPAIIVGHIGQVLDFSDHVVAEIAHHATLQRRQVGDDRRAIGSNDCVKRREHALVKRNLGAEVLALDLDESVAQLERRDRVVADEAVPRPALGMLDGLEQEALAISDQLEIRRHRRLQIAQNLRPHRHHRVLGSQRMKFRAARPHRRCHAFHNHGFHNHGFHIHGFHIHDSAPKAR